VCLVPARGIIKHLLSDRYIEGMHCNRLVRQYIDKGSGMRWTSLMGLLLALAVVGVLLKHQLTAVRGAGAASSTASDAGLPMPPEVTTPAQGRQLQQQVKDELDRAAQERTRQIEQGIDRNAP
jgi:hypothetical protein